MSPLFLTCRDAVALLTDFQEGALDRRGTFAVRLHLAFCGPCAALARSLQALPAAFQNLGLEPASLPPEFQAQGRTALQAVLARLDSLPEAPTELPELLRTPPPGGADGPWNLLVEAFRAISAGDPGPDESGLPPSVLDRLPPRSQWSWKRLGFAGTRVATLLEDARTRARLVLLHIPPGGGIPFHTHLGREALLVLDGEMEDAAELLVTGEVRTFEPGSRHAQRVGLGGCWCLMRLESPGFRLHGLPALLG